MLILFALFIFFSCEKMKDCISGPGEEISITYDLDEFDTIVVNNVFHVSLVQDRVNSIKISGYEDFVRTTEFYIEDNCLILDNCHRCPFVKPEKNKVNIEIHINQISRIRLNEASVINSVNTLTHENEIGLIVSSKYNEANLKLDVNTFYYWNTHLNGGKIYVSGEGTNLKLWNTSLGSVDASGFKCERAFVQTNSKTDCYINASVLIDAEIKNSGNIYYIGNPEIIQRYSDFAEGRLIPME